MKKLFKASALFAILATSSLYVVSCEPKPVNEDPKLELGASLSVEKATETTVTMNISLQKDAQGYSYAIGQSGDLNAFKEGTLEGIKVQNDVSVKTFSFEGLKENTKYLVFAQAFAGQEKGSVTTLSVTTAEVEREPDLNLTMELENATEDAFVVKMQYSDDVEAILYAYGTPNDLEAFTNGTLATIVEHTAVKQKLITVTGMERGKEYTVFAQAVAGDKKGNVATVTGKTYQLDIELKLLEDELTTTTAAIEVTPSGDTNKYKYAMGPIDILPMFENGTWLEIQWENDATQPRKFTVKGLKPGEETTLFVQPFAANGASGKTKYLTIKTLTEEPVE